MTLAELIASWEADGRDEDVQTLHQRLETLEGGEPGCVRFVANIHVESRFVLAIWTQVGEALLAASDDRDEMQKVLCDLFVQHRMSGGSVPQRPVLLGRASTWKALTGLLRKQSVPEELLSSLVDQALSSVAEARSVLGDKWLARKGHIMWATFDPTDSDLDPFRDDGSAERIWSRLGLCHISEKARLLLLVYSLPADWEAAYPTLADACADTNWNPKFRPSPDGSPYGLTEPLLDGDHASPEVVHWSITGATLQIEVREAVWS